MDKNIKPTRDKRIFKTTPKAIPGQEHDKINQVRSKTYFACLVNDGNQNCFGVDVIAPVGTNTKEEDDKAFSQVLDAVEYYERTGNWPTRPQGETPEGDGAGNTEA